MKFPAPIYDPAMRDQELKPADLAKVLGVSPQTVSNWSRKGIAGLLLRCTWRGAHRRYTLSDYEAWQEAVQERLHPPKPELIRSYKKRQRECVARLRAMGIKV